MYDTAISSNIFVHPINRTACSLATYSILFEKKNRKISSSTLFTLQVYRNGNIEVEPNVIK